MKFQLNLVARWLAVVCMVMAASALGFGSSADRTQFGRNITVETGEQATEVTCFGCSVHVRGHVSGDVTTFGGSVFVEDQAEIGGDTTTFAGSVRLDKGASVREVTVFGGRLQRDPGALVRGDITNFSGIGWLLLIVALPIVFLGAFVALVIWIVRKLTRPAVPAAT